MDQNTDKLIKEQFSKLPEALQRAITLMPWRELVRGVAGGNNLSAQSEVLETETMLVIYGFEGQESLLANLVRELGLEENRAKKIAEELDQKVFTPVLTKAEELASNSSGETLQTAVPEKPQVQEPAPRVVVEAPKPESSNKPSINLIPAPKPEEKPLNLLPPNLPTGKPMNMMDEKLMQVVSTPRNVTSYPDGKDPYREPVI